MMHWFKDLLEVQTIRTLYLITHMYYRRSAILHTGPEHVQDGAQLPSAN